VLVAPISDIFSDYFRFNLVKELIFAFGAGNHSNNLERPIPIKEPTTEPITIPEKAHTQGNSVKLDMRKHKSYHFGFLKSKGSL